MKFDSPQTSVPFNREMRSIVTRGPPGSRSATEKVGVKNTVKPIAVKRIRRHRRLSAAARKRLVASFRALERKSGINPVMDNYTYANDEPRVRNHRQETGPTPKKDAEYFGGVD